MIFPRVSITSGVCSLLFVAGCAHLGSNGPVLHEFSKQILTDQFWSEGATFADINRDGKMDVVAGPFWYEGPAFSSRHEFMAADRVSKSMKNGVEVTFPGYKGALGSENEYSANFFAFSEDFNRDGWTDILILGFPGENSWWFENPGANAASVPRWKQHVAIDVTDNESPHFTDIDGNGVKDIVCASKGYYGYATPGKDPTQLWTFHRISPDLKIHKFTHGLGVGDVNGDGRMDLMEKDGWWEQPVSLSGDPVWQRHPWTFGVGGAQMYAYDVNGDGLNDVITSLAGHGYGLAWFEQYREGKEIKFREHIIMNKEARENRYGVKITQMHGIELVDMNGDGLKDIITGKRFWAHGPKGDPESDASPELYWLELQRSKDGTVNYVPHLVDNRSGVGTELKVRDYNGDQRPDILVGNKYGVFVFTHRTRSVSAAEYDAAQPKPIYP